MCTKYILHILIIVQHISTHRTCHHQGIFVAVILSFQMTRCAAIGE